jgi:hypothetical protein
MRKRKPRHSSEFKIVGYGDGTNGKEKGAILWILETKTNVQFTVVPIDMTYIERYELFSSMSLDLFETKYRNKMMTVEYDDLSSDGVPLRAKAKCIRDYD